jgi:hypothetical protein
MASITGDFAGEAFTARTRSRRDFRPGEDEAVGADRGAHCQRGEGGLCTVSDFSRGGPQAESRAGPDWFPRPF